MWVQVLVVVGLFLLTAVLGELRKRTREPRLDLAAFAVAVPGGILLWQIGGSVARLTSVGQLLLVMAVLVVCAAANFWVWLRTKSATLFMCWTVLGAVVLGALINAVSIF